MTGILSLIFLKMLTIVCQSQTAAQARIVPIAKGWASTSVNAVVFRRNSVASHENSQYVAFYDAEKNVVLAFLTVCEMQAARR